MDTSTRDLILAPNEFAFVSNEANAIIETYVGPHKTSLAKECQPVLFDKKSKRFNRVTLDQAIQMFPIAPEGWYLILKNPTVDNKHPKDRQRNESAELSIGRKVNIPGPTGFALFPGQMVKVVQGHNIRTNQYLLVRIYDDVAAKANAQQAIIKPADNVDPQTPPAAGNDNEKNGSSIPPTAPITMNLTMGALNIIKGTEVSFYIPPTGIEVVADENGNYVREAVTLERLEYAILVGENGVKEYPQGPTVVFPQPTQKFIQRDGFSKFRALELNPNMGIYVKVNNGYTEGEGPNKITYNVGDELFITGKTTKIYFPRDEHSIIKQGDTIKHYAVAIPKGEARYVLDKDTGEINMVRGPKMFLADPRSQVIVRRVLSVKDTDLWFPGNEEAKLYNQELAAAMSEGEEFVREPQLRSLMGSKSRKMGSNQNSSERRGLEGMYMSNALSNANFYQNDAVRSSSDELTADSMNRGTQFTPPRTITIDTKYEGAVCINVWPGNAVQVVRRTGEREVVIGPKSVLLEYDAKLEILSLSTGKPKTTDRLLHTTYLQIKHNLVSDEITVVTKDMVTCTIKVSYRVSFDGPPENWFMISNYVKYLTDHMRSLLGNTVKQKSIEELNNDTVTIVRDTVLGPKSDKNEKRSRTFPENGMVVYDVEILKFNIGDSRIASLLQQAQTDAVRQTLEVANAERDLIITQKMETIKRKKNSELTLTAKQILSDEALVTSEKAIATQAIHQFNLKSQEIIDEIAVHERNRNIANDKATLDTEQARITANVTAFVEKMKAVSPDLIAAINNAAQMGLLEKLAVNLPHMPTTLLGRQGMSAVMDMLKGTPLADLFTNLGKSTNGVISSSKDNVPA